MAKLTEMDDETAAATLLRIFRQACDAYDPASGASHPGQVIKKMRMDTAEWVRASATGSAPGSSERQIQSQDNPPDFEGKPENPALSVPPRPTQDGRFTIQSDGVPRFEAVNAKGDTVSIVTGDAALEARSRQSNPTRAANMASRIAGYTRLK